MSKTVPFETIQFSIRIQIEPLSGATTLGQSGPRSDDNEGVLCIPGTSPSDCLVSCPGHSLGAVCVFYSPSRLGKNSVESSSQMTD